MLGQAFNFELGFFFKFQSNYHNYEASNEGRGEKARVGSCLRTSSSVCSKKKEEKKKKNSDFDYWKQN